MLTWNRGEKLESTNIFNNLEELNEKSKATNDIVNDLLLSANELTIYGKSSLIEYNKDGVKTDMLLEEIKADPAKAYQRILKNKLNNLKRKASAVPDFYVKPVPK
ncbi:MAG: hypothetical protein WAU23_00955 [Ferruginibacter sp.]